jgi:hypothetical protein
MAVVGSGPNEKRPGEGADVFRIQNIFRQNAHASGCDALIAARSRILSSIVPSFSGLLNSTGMLNRLRDCVLWFARVLMAFSFVFVWSGFAFTATETNHGSGL